MSDRPHLPTARRLREAARDGDVPFSMELAHNASLLAGLLAIGVLATPLLKSIVKLATRQLRTAGHSIHAVQVDQEALSDVALSAIPLLAALLFVGWISSGTQRGFRWTMPKLRWSRLHPAANLKRIKSDADTAMVGWLKSTLLLMVGGHLLWQEMASLASIGQLPPLALALTIAAMLGRLVTGLALAMAGIGIVDYLWQRRRHSNRLRMTEEELRRERRDDSPSPEVRRKGRALASRFSNR